MKLTQGGGHVAACRRAQERSRQLGATVAAGERATGRLTALARAAGVLVQGATALTVLHVAIQSGVDTVAVAVLGLTALAAVETVLPVADAAQRFVRARPALHRVAALLSQSAAPPWVPPESATDLVLSDVQVRYGHRTALDVDLTIRAGGAVAVVGASGAGKSTLLEVLAGLVEPSAGTVRLAPSRALTQDAHLFHTTIRANLTLARPTATTAQLAHAARTAGVLDWIESLPAGWDTTVGENLSGGQRQRLLLARALLAESRVLLLDEPTEGLDATHADEVLDAVLTTRRGRTTIVVTHRLTPLAAFDDVLVMDEGRIVDQGTHAALAARPGPYRDLWDAEQLTADRSVR